MFNRRAQTAVLIPDWQSATTLWSNRAIITVRGALYWQGCESWITRLWIHLKFRAILQRQASETVYPELNKIAWVIIGSQMKIKQGSIWPAILALVFLFFKIVFILFFCINPQYNVPVYCDVYRKCFFVLELDISCSLLFSLTWHWYALLCCMWQGLDGSYYAVSSKTDFSVLCCFTVETLRFLRWDDWIAHASIAQWHLKSTPTHSLNSNPWTSTTLYNWLCTINQQSVKVKPWVDSSQPGCAYASCLQSHWSRLSGDRENIKDTWICPFTNGVLPCRVIQRNRGW